MIIFKRHLFLPRSLIVYLTVLHMYTVSKVTVFPSLFIIAILVANYSVHIKLVVITSTGERLSQVSSVFEFRLPRLVTALISPL